MSLERRFDPEPEAVYESGDEDDDERGDEEGGEEGRVPSPEADGSQEEAEKEDSVGLLSAAPSPKGSLAGLRQHFPHRRAGGGGGNGSRSGSSAGSRSPQGRVASGAGSVSGSASSRSGRSRTQSLIRTLGQRASLASLGEFGVGGRSRSRTRSGGSSMRARNEESNGEESSPRSAAGTGTGSGSRRESGSASVSASASGTGSGRPSGEGAPGIEHTFGRGGELTQQRERLERMESEAGLVVQSSLGQGLLGVPEGAGGGSDASLRRAASDVSGLTMSEATERQAGDDAARTEAGESRTDLSAAHASFVTAPMTIESTTTTDHGDHSRDSTWVVRHQHVPGGPWGHHGPA